MPSPCAALTSAACLSSALTASRSPSCAASATESGGAAGSSAEIDNAPQRTISEPVLISLFDISNLRYGRTRSRAVQIERRRAVAEALHVVEADLLQHRQHDVGERRAIRRAMVQPALQCTAGAAGEEQRDALVVVQVRIAHRRAVHQ